MAPNWLTLASTFSDFYCSEFVFGVEIFTAAENGFQVSNNNGIFGITNIGLHRIIKSQSLFVTNKTNEAYYLFLLSLAMVEASEQLLAIH